MYFVDSSSGFSSQVREHEILLCEQIILGQCILSRLRKYANLSLVLKSLEIRYIQQTCIFYSPTGLSNLQSGIQTESSLWATLTLKTIYLWKYRFTESMRSYLWDISLWKKFHWTFSIKLLRFCFKEWFPNTLYAKVQWNVVLVQIYFFQSDNWKVKFENVSFEKSDRRTID